jgi:hypothetical protein
MGQHKIDTGKKKKKRTKKKEGGEQKILCVAW